MSKVRESSGYSQQQLLNEITTDIGWGRWQTNVLMLMLVNALCACFHSLLLPLLAPNIDFRCIVPKESTSTIPEEQCEVDGEICTKWSYDVAQLPDQHYYHRHQHQPHNHNEHETNETMLFNVSNISTPTTSVIDHHHKTFYQATITSEWDLVCGRRWLASFSQSIFMIGWLCSIVMSHFSDRVGRRPITIIASIISIVGSILCAFSYSIIQFFIARFLIAFGVGTVYSTGFVLLLEITSAKYRNVVGLAIQLGWGVGYLFMPAVFYLVPHFRWALSIFSLIQMTQFIFLLKLTESPRWLLTKGRQQKFLQTVEIVAERNQLLNKEQFVQKVEFLLKHVPKNVGKPDKKYSIIHLFKTAKLAKMTIIIYFNWFVDSLVYYGVSLNSNQLEGNRLLNFLLMGATEVPAYLFSMYIVKKWGQRTSLVATLSGAAIGCFGTILIKYWNYHFGISLAVFGKLCITCSYAIMFVYTAEMYPTVVRTIGLGSGNMVSRIGSILAPFINELIYYTSLEFSSIMLGAFSLTAAMLLLLLNENTDNQLPDRPEEIKLRKMTKTSLMDEENGHC